MKRRTLYQQTADRLSTAEEHNESVHDRPARIEGYVLKARSTGLVSHCQERGVLGMTAALWPGLL